MSHANVLFYFGTPTLKWFPSIPAKYTGSSFPWILRLALKNVPSLAPPVVFRRVMVKFSAFSGICIKQIINLSCNILWFSIINKSIYSRYCKLLFTSSGRENKVKFFRFSPSTKMISPCTGLTSPDWPGFRTQKTDTFPNVPLLLPIG